MKKILMLALVCSLATGAFANSKPKKQKRNKQRTQQVCPPECQQNGCCTKSNCAKM